MGCSRRRVAEQDGWAAAVVVVIFVGSFIVPEVLGPLPLIAAVVAAVWIVVVVVRLGLT